MTNPMRLKVDKDNTENIIFDVFLDIRMKDILRIPYAS